MSFSLFGDEVNDMKSEDVIGVEIDSSGHEKPPDRLCVLGQSSMKCLRACWGIEVSRFAGFCDDEAKVLLLLSKVEVFCEGFKRESEVTKPNSLFLEDSSYGMFCLCSMKGLFSYGLNSSVGGSIGSEEPS